MDRRKLIGQRIERARKELNWSQEDFGKFVNLSGAHVSRMEKGVVGFDIDDLQRYAKVLGKSVEWFYSDKIESEDRPIESILAELQQRVKHPIFRELPLLGYIPCGYPLPNEQQAEGKVKVFRDDLGYAKDKEGLYALIASGDSLLEDGINKGDKMIVDPIPPDYPEGKIYAVRIGDEVTCKHVFHVDDKVRLVSSNSHYEEQIYNADDVEVMGRVILWGNWHKA